LSQDIQNIQDDPITFIASNGIKVTLNNSPSPEACKNFIRVVMDIKAKYNIRINE
jgi:hypothetical protein